LTPQFIENALIYSTHHDGVIVWQSSLLSPAHSCGQKLSLL